MIENYSGLDFLWILFTDFFSSITAYTLTQCILLK